MFTFQTTPQLIIGLNSLHPLFRMVKENHFKKIAVIFHHDALGHIPIQVRRIVKKISHRGVECTLYPLKVWSDSVEIAKNTELIISYGNRSVHDVAKQSNRMKAHNYCIETVAGHMSSLGTGVVWEEHQTAWLAIFPQVIFNSCQNVHCWNIEDYLYFLHDISLALEAVFNVKEIDDFAVACAFGGSLQIIKLYAKMLYIKSKRKLKKMYQLLAQADVLCKNAYNNTHLSLEVKRVAESVEHYRQFEVVTAYESLDMVNNLIRRHRTKIENILQHFNWELNSFIKSFNQMYKDFTNHPKRWETCGDILGKKMIQIMGKNQETRKLM